MRVLLVVEVEGFGFGGVAVLGCALRALLVVEVEGFGFGGVTVLGGVLVDAMFR